MSPSRFECLVPHCGKLFVRKEHLTRHAKSHDPQPQYLCPVCGRRYARSDVLRRHVQAHTQQTTDTHEDAEAAVEANQQNDVQPTVPQPSTLPVDTVVNTNSSLPSHASSSLSHHDGPAWSFLQDPWVPTTLQPASTIDTSPPSHSALSIPTVSSVSDWPSLSGGRTLVDRDSPATAQLIDVYWAQVHPYWPMLHAPTFKANAASESLVAAMLLLASYVQGSNKHLELAPFVLDNIMATHMQLKASLNTLQALLLCVVYTTHCLDIEGMQTRALLLHGILVSTCRYLNIFSGEQSPPDAPLDDSAFAEWLAEEQLRRVAYGTLRIDALLSILTDHPPSVRFQELCIPLPKTSSLWTAASQDQRRKLQWSEPAGRANTPFCFLMRDALQPGREPFLPYNLNLDDHHLCLSALQCGVWEATRDSHGFGADPLVTRLKPENPTNTWLSHLTLWRLEAESEVGLGHDYWSFPQQGHNIAPLTIALWHVSMLKIYAPLKLLRVPANFTSHALRDQRSVQPTRNKLRTWLSSECCRTSVWHGTQLGHLLENELAIGGVGSARLKMNPLIVPGVLMGAVAACFYAYHTRACPICQPDLTTNTPIELFVSKHDDAHVKQWINTGEGLGMWCLDLPICQCALGPMSNWFRKLLASNQKATRELESFLIDLEKEVPAAG